MRRGMRGRKNVKRNEEKKECEERGVCGVGGPQF